MKNGNHIDNHGEMGFPNSSPKYLANIYLANVRNLFLYGIEILTYAERKSLMEIDD